LGTDLVIDVKNCNLETYFTRVVMGYHVIIDPELFPIKYTYVSGIGELVWVEGMNERSVIVEGKPENPPQQVGISADFRRLGEAWYRAELRARTIFAKLARDRQLVLEELNREPENFNPWVKAGKGKVKRGNFLVRNRGNIEVEVTCRSFYGRGVRKYFCFSQEDLRKHLNTEKVTHIPVIVAVFERKGDKPAEESLCMIKIDRIRELIPELVCEEKDDEWVYRIPLEETVKGFDLLGSYGMEDYEDAVDLVEREFSKQTDQEELSYVIVAYYKNQEHLEWIIRNGLYNLRAGGERGALSLGRKEACARYILLHTRGETYTGKLFRILETGPQVYSRDSLIRKKYPGRPGHELYWVYKVVPVLEKELQKQTWDISRLSGYTAGHGAAFPFTVPLSELME